MTTFDARTLYELLPTIVRLRDAEQGGALRELVDVIADQAALVEADLDKLYDDAFVETCAPWVLPYIGDLLGITGLPRAQGPYNPRAEVGHTLAMRRRKGTAAMLEQLARDVTRWDARAVEFFQIVATTQSMKRIRPEHHGFVSLRNGTRLLDLDSAFERGAPPSVDTNQPLRADITHRVDVRRMGQGVARHNLPNIGLFVFRINAYARTLVNAYRRDDQRFTFHPLGADVALFCFPRTEDDVTHLADPINVPHPIHRRELAASIAADASDLYGDGPGAENPASMRVYSPNGAQVSRSEVIACDLSAWSIPNWPNGKTLAIDAALGRLVWKDPVLPGKTILVSYHEGACADLGGGEYERGASLAPVAPDVLVVQIPGTPGNQIGFVDALSTIATLGAVRAIIEITDSGTYDIDPALIVWPPEAKRIEIQAVNGCRPTLRVQGALQMAANDVDLALRGLLISATELRHSGTAGKLRLSHCTLVLPLAAGTEVPHRCTLGSVVATAPGIHVDISHSIVGGLRIHPDAEVSIADSIVDAGSPTSIAFANVNGNGFGGSIRTDACTMVGKVWASATALLQNSIFHATLAMNDTWTAPVRIRRRQEGCVRFCYVPPNSLTPPRYKCQPEAGSTVTPAFTSLRYGDAGYAQLHRSTPPEISRGADDESEMGVYHGLFQPQREAHLTTRLREYLRFGLEAGIVYAT